MQQIKDTILADFKVVNAMDILTNTSSANCSKYSQIIPIDNWGVAYKHRRRFLKVLDKINKEQGKFRFEFNGDEFRPDLIITSIFLKKEYDAIPKTKTMRDVLEKVYKDFGITTDIGFHVDLDKKITDEEFNNQVEMYRMMSQISFKDLEEDDTNE